jgi:hypothetical protein
VWRDEIERFIAALEADQALKGPIAYRCMKAENGSGEYHLAATADDAAKALQQRDFFKLYTAETKRASGGMVEARPLTIVAETSTRP